MQHVSLPTHRLGHTLDLVITRSNDNLISDLVVNNPLVSDHHVVHFDILTSKPSLPKKSISYRCFKKLDLSAFKKDVIQSELSSQISTVPNDLVSSYNSVLQSLLDKHVPIKERMITVRPLAPWYTSEIQNLRTIKKKSERKWQQTKLTVHKEIYCSNRNILTNRIKVEKKSYIQSKINNSSQSQKTLFKCIDDLFYKAKDKKLPQNIPLEDLPEKFSEFFVSKIQKIHSNFSCEHVQSPSLESNVNSLSVLDPASMEEVRKMILTSASKSCISDPIPTFLLKECLDELLPSITQIINTSLASASVPDVFKRAVVTPVLKKSTLDPDLLSNFRPVSNLPYVSKLLEKIVSKRLHSHKSVNGLTEPLQSAYRPGHSTETAVLRVHNDILKAIDDGHCVFLVLLDLSAAFDTVSHEILLNCLHTEFGVTGKALTWISSYLSQRSQAVLINGTLSSSSILRYGVPQGSVLGPDFFTDYTVALASIIRSFSVQYHCYADDTQLYSAFIPGVDELSVLQNLESCIDGIRIWMHDNKLKLNDTKTEFIVLGTPAALKKVQSMSLRVGNQIIPASKTVRNIGAYFDDHLRMDKQVSATCKVAWYTLYNISRIRRFLTRDQAKSAIHAYVTSKLDYNNALLAMAPQSLIYKLQRVQNASARLISGTKKHEHITPVLSSLHWLPVHLRVLFKVLLVTFKALYAGGPRYLCDLLIRHQSARVLRSTSDPYLLHIPKSRLKTFGDKSFSVYAPIQWNNLPLSIRTSSSVDSFKSALKTHLFIHHFSNS